MRLLHSRRGQLQLELTSPSGTTSVLKPVMSGDTQADFSPWLFSSVHFWGEAADGVWTLRCIDTEPEMTGVLVRADLRVFGTSPQKDDYEFWLDEQFTASVVSDPLLRDPSGGDFTVLPGSPAWALGWRAIDTGAVGPR